MWQQEKGAGRESLEAVKRKWDQDTDQEPDKKKTETSQNVEKPKTFSMGIKKSPQAVGSTNVGSIPKMKFGFGDTKKVSCNLTSSQDCSKKPAAPIKMTLGTQKPKEAATVLPVTKPSSSVASAFNEDSESDEEEMPPEAKMRMKNVGRNTPTAAGPNSFGKSKLGFCDRQRMIQKQLEDANSD